VFAADRYDLPPMVEGLGYGMVQAPKREKV
jgi:hypothetical protein